MDRKTGNKFTGVHWNAFKHSDRSWPSTRVLVQEIWANAHETRDSISLISYRCCLRLSPLISIQFSLEMYVAASNRRKQFTKTPILRFKVVQSHWCWYHQKGRRQCLLWHAASLCLSATVFTLDEPIVVKITIFRGYPSLMPSFEGNLLTQRHQITS